MMYSCTNCDQKFAETKYLNQHIGGKRCYQRKEYLQKTSSFTLALSASPSSPSNQTGTRDCGMVRIEVFVVYLIEILVRLGACFARRPARI